MYTPLLALNSISHFVSQTQTRFVNPSPRRGNAPVYFTCLYTTDDVDRIVSYRIIRIVRRQGRTTCSARRSANRKRSASRAVTCARWPTATYTRSIATTCSTSCRCIPSSRNSSSATLSSPTTCATYATQRNATQRRRRRRRRRRPRSNFYEKRHRVTCRYGGLHDSCRCMPLLTMELSILLRTPQQRLPVVYSGPDNPKNCLSRWGISTPI